MKRRNAWFVVALAGMLCGGAWRASAQTVVAELTTAYHHIKVVDEGVHRFLSFDGSMESRIVRDHPLEGHFEYTLYFQMPWIWNPDIQRVLMVGLGGGTAQARFAHDVPGVDITTVELDPMVVTVARQYFGFQVSDQQKVRVEDGRVYLRRTREVFDLIVMDAYTSQRYGSSLPQHLATQEFFELARSRLRPNGVLCYNVMGDWKGAESRLVAALHNTLKTTFPHVYFFPVPESKNVILVAPTLERRLSFSDMNARGAVVTRDKKITFPGFRRRIYEVKTQAAYGMDKAPVLTDDHAPIEGLIRSSEGNQPGPVKKEE